MIVVQLYHIPVLHFLQEEMETFLWRKVMCLLWCVCVCVCVCACVARVFTLRIVISFCLILERRPGTDLRDICLMATVSSVC